MVPCSSWAAGCTAVSPQVSEHILRLTHAASKLKSYLDSSRTQTGVNYTIASNDSASQQLNSDPVHSATQPSNVQRTYTFTVGTHSKDFERAGEYTTENSRTRVTNVLTRTRQSRNYLPRLLNTNKSRTYSPTTLLKGRRLPTSRDIHKPKH